MQVNQKNITALLLFLGLPVFLAGISSVGATGSSSYPAPYTGGAPIVKYFHLQDGSTVTITCTGAVIKQSPGHTAYREGWVNTSTIGNITTSDQLGDQMAAGSSNPYGSQNVCNQSTSSNAAATTTQPSAPAINVTASATASSTTTPATSTSSTPTQPVTTAAAAPVSGKALPNTGAGGVFAIGAVTTVLGTVGHLLYQRFRLAKFAC